MNFAGKIPRTHRNMRVEFAQMCALNADHNSLYNISNINKKYDIVILLIPKTDSDRKALQSIDVINESRKIGDKVLFMQEGPSWIFQDMTVEQQIWHYHILTSVDGILTENETDIKYFKGINPNIPITDITSLMITDSVEKSVDIVKEEKVIIGGNFTRWYGGFDSFVTARYFDCPIYAPSMGRRQPNEESFVKHLPYMEWVDWIHKLAEFKYAVHLMPTIAAGTFAMNCGYLSIPCIGYSELDTQRNIHPKLSVDIGDLESATKLADMLKTDIDFYNECCLDAKNNYEKHHSEIVVKEKLINFFETI